MVVAIPLGFNGTLYQSAKRCDFKSVAEMLTLKKTVSNKGSMEKGEGCSNWRDLSSDDENYEADHSENDSNSFETPTPTRRGKKIRGTFSHVSLDGVPKEGLRIQDILLRIALLTMISDKALDLKEEEAKAIFEELISRESMDEHNSSLIQFYIRLLTLILGDSKEEFTSLSTKNKTNSWLKHLEGLVMQSYHLLDDFPLDWFQEGISGYYKLDLPKKFKLMTLLCDEALNTEKLRSYIQDENSRHAKEVKETKLKIAAAKEKIKCLAQLQNERANENVKVGEAHAEMLRLKSTSEKYKSGCDASRINPEFVDNNGMTFWKVQSYNDECVLLQDTQIQDETATFPEERWFVYSLPEKDEIGKYISFRTKRLKRLNSQPSL